MILMKWNAYFKWGTYTAYGLCHKKPLITSFGSDYEWMYSAEWEGYRRQRTNCTPWRWWEKGSWRNRLPKSPQGVAGVLRKKVCLLETTQAKPGATMETRSDLIGLQLWCPEDGEEEWASAWKVRAVYAEREIRCHTTGLGFILLISSGLKDANSRT